jgi:hypothetical protein
MIFLRTNGLLLTIFFSLYLASNSLATRANEIIALKTGKSVLSATDSEESFFNRKSSLKRMGEPKYIDNSGPKAKSYDVLAATAQKGCGPSEWPAYMASLSNLNM